MDNSIEEQINNLVSKLQDIEKQDITHDELGPANGFHDANSTKKQIERYALDILDDIKKHIDNLPLPLVQDNIVHIEEIINKLNDISKNIDALAESGVHDGNYPKQRQHFTQQLHDTHKQLIKLTGPLKTNIDVDIIKSTLGSDASINKAREEAEENSAKAKAALDEILRLQSSIENVSQSVQSDAIKTGVIQSGTNFSTLQKSHRNAAWLWFVGLVISSIGLIIAVYNVVEMEPEIYDICFESVVEFSKKILLITLPSIFMRISLTKYNTERSLEIIYGHRQQVLDQYSVFESAIDPEYQEAKNQFRLEIAKYIFSDPQTGYLPEKNNSPTEINVNPILSAVDKFTPKDK